MVLNCCGSQQSLWARHRNMDFLSRGKQAMAPEQRVSRCTQLHIHASCLSRLPQQSS